MREFPVATSPHLPPRASVPALMYRVLAALVPGAALATWQFGWGIPLQLALACLVAVAAEAAMLALRRRPVGRALADGSALVTAALLALALPPYAPWWLTAVAVLAAVVLAKHLYGGLGYNPFNPAMVGYVVVLIAFPRELGHWPAPAALAGGPDLATALSVVFGGTPLPDALTAATPLDHVRTGLSMNRTLAELRADPVMGRLAGTGWEWVALGYLAGGLWLVWKRVADWRIPLGFAAGLALPALLAWGLDPDAYPSPLFHLLSGGAMLGAFFIATDPVTASTTPRGRLLFGAGAGLVTFLVRGFGGYPDGVAFGVLLMNMAAPTLDQLTRPRVFGERR